MLTISLENCKIFWKKKNQNLSFLDMQKINSKEITPVICTLLLQSRLTNEEPDEVGVMLVEKVIQIHQAGESAFIVFGNMPFHGYRQSVCCLKLKNYSISMAALHRNKNEIETRHSS